jgi:hypothetical protein
LWIKRYIVTETKMDGLISKSVKLPLFDGEEKSYMIWWSRFEAYAGCIGFADALEAGGEAVMPASYITPLDGTKEDGILALAAKKRNQVAMANLTMAFQSEGSMSLIYESKTSAWPMGLAHKVISEMKQEYHPEDTMTRVELRHKLASIKMKKKTNPKTIFEQISAIKNRYNTSTRKIDNDDLIAVILDAAPYEYQAVLTAVQMMYGNQLTVLHLKTAMNSHWRTTDACKALLAAGNEKTKDSDEFGLIAGAFGGVCFTCKKKGHKAHECPDKPANKIKAAGAAGARFTGKCNNCGKQGHKEAQCWEKEENKSKRPNGYKVKEQAQVNADTGGSKVDYLLCATAMAFPVDSKMLSDPNVWIADTGATVHTTPYATGMHDIKEASDDDSITVGNGTTVKALRVASITGSYALRQAWKRNGPVKID